LYDPSRYFSGVFESIRHIKSYGSTGRVGDHLVFLRSHHQEQTPRITGRFPVDGTGIASAIVAPAYHLALHVEISQQHEELFDRRVMMARIAARVGVLRLVPGRHAKVRRGDRQGGASAGADPVSAEVNTLLGHILYLARRYDQAVEQLHRALDLDANYWFAHLVLGLVLQQQGKLPAAIDQFQRSRREEPVSPETMGALGQAYARAGETAKALEILEKLDKWSQRYYVSPFHRAEYTRPLAKRTRRLPGLKPPTRSARST
jgi:tetratricopeptide (TPR) repeat protein